MSKKIYIYIHNIDSELSYIIKNTDDYIKFVINYNDKILCYFENYNYTKIIENINGPIYYYNKIKLFNTRIDALQKTNEIDIVGVSSGFHFIRTLKNKNTF